MHSADDIAQKTIKLLSAIDLDEVVDIAAELVIEMTGALSVSVLMWDQDLERIADRFIFGIRRRDFAQFVEVFSERSNGQQSFRILSKSDLDGIDVVLPKDLQPVVIFPVREKEELYALILVAGATVSDPDKLKESLAVLPLSKALAHAWEYRELERENERLRAHYEEIEDKTSRMKEQTVKLIRDITARESIRAEQVERERLVYWISNAVRSSVQIREVLETTVEKIGTTIGVSRCLLLRSLGGPDQLEVFEFVHELIPAVKNLFYSSDGFAFTQTALGRTSPHDLQDPELDSQSTYDSSFLRRLGIRSGLIVPLVMRERVLGVLFLQDCTEQRQWSIDDVSLIGSLADHLSVAIENAELHQEREHQAVTDGLTGVANRRNFNESLKRECERARRYEQSLSLILIDLDFLKKINDTYGHQAGDEAIKAIGKVLKQSSRSIDLPARYGGEEFCLILPNTDIEMAFPMAERLRRLISETEIEGVGHITASLGVASFPLHADGPETLFQRADEALYKAKEAGRNQVKVACATDKTQASPDKGEKGECSISDNRLSQLT